MYRSFDDYLSANNRYFHCEMPDCNHIHCVCHSEDCDEVHTEIHDINGVEACDDCFESFVDRCESERLGRAWDRSTDELRSLFINWRAGRISFAEYDSEVSRIDETVSIEEVVA